MTDKCALERIVGSERYERLRNIRIKDKIGFKDIIDTTGAISYSLVFGAVTDVIAGLNLVGIISSRASSIPANLATGSLYNRLRDYLYKETKTTKESSKWKKSAVEFAAFNIFQTPLYAAIVGGSAIVQGLIKGDLNLLEAVYRADCGAVTLYTASPIAGLLMGAWQTGTRKLCGLKTSGELAGEEKAVK